jgi:riboflavin biosynthesis pyrimidine reductase
MDSRSVAIEPPKEAFGRRPVQRRPRDLRSPKVEQWSDHRGQAIAITGFGDRDARFRRSSCPVSVIAIRRFRRSPCFGFGDRDGPNSAAGDLRPGVQTLKDATPAGVLLGSGTLATELDRLELIDEYKFLVHPRIAGHGPTLYQRGLPSTRRFELVSAKPLRNGAVAMHYRRAC